MTNDDASAPENEKDFDKNRDEFDKRVGEERRTFVAVLYWSGVGALIATFVLFGVASIGIAVWGRVGIDLGLGAAFSLLLVYPLGQILAVCSRRGRENLGLLSCFAAICFLIDFFVYLPTFASAV